MAVGMCEDVVVKSGIEALHFTRIVDVFLHAFDQPFELRVVTVVHSPCRTTRGERFKRFTNFEDADDFIEVELTHDAAAIATRFEHAFRLEPAQRFADRRPARTERRRDVGFDDRRPGREVARKNRRSQTVVDLIPQRARTFDLTDEAAAF